MNTHKTLACLLLVVIALPIAGVFGVAHDQISYSVSSEYFTRFKFIQFGLVDSYLPARILAGIVGFLASWWMGIPIGLLIAPFALIHRGGTMVFRSGLTAFMIVVACTLLFALGGLGYGYLQTEHIDPEAYSRWFFPADLISPRRFLCAGYMHNAAYLGGVVGIPVAWLYLLLTRFRRPQPVQAQPASLPAGGSCVSSSSEHPKKE